MRRLSSRNLLLDRSARPGCPLRAFRTWEEQGPTVSMRIACELSGLHSDARCEDPSPVYGLLTVSFPEDDCKESELKDVHTEDR